jgi:hypothetical protein
LTSARGGLAARILKIDETNREVDIGSYYSRMRQMSQPPTLDPTLHEHPKMSRGTFSIDESLQGLGVPLLVIEGAANKLSADG